LKLYRGVKEEIEDGIHKNENISRERKPRDSDLRVHKASNRWFKEKFGVAARSRAVFCTTDIEQTKDYCGNYGYTFEITPFHGENFQLIFSEDIYDFNEHEAEINDFNDEQQIHRWLESKNYQSVSDINDIPLDFKGEVMLICGCFEAKNVTIESEPSILEKLDLLNIDGYEFKNKFGGGSALSGLYTKGNRKVVFKFLISPRNRIELERFKLEFSVLDMNKINFPIKGEENSIRKNLFIGPEESYPLPRICYPLTHKQNKEVSYFGYEYEDGILLSDLDTCNYSSKDKVKLLHRIASGLSNFNQCGYSHRDLHPENILLLDNHKMDTYGEGKNNPKIKILDMGNCQRIITDVDFIYKIKRKLNEKKVFEDNNRRLLTSFTCMPPDFLEKGDQTENYDSWSFGVLAYTLMFGDVPFEFKTISDVTTLRSTKVQSNDFVDNLNSLNIGFKLILKHLLSSKGSERPTIDSIVRLFNWIAYREDEFTDVQFIKRVIHENGFDPDYDFVRDDY
jgi:serine/threonine protein kinase